jgi:hypothetical protein
MTGELWCARRNAPLPESLVFRLVWSPALTTAPENMTLSTLAKISRALQVTPSQLMDEADAKAAKTFLRLLRLPRQKIEAHCQQRGERG